MHRAFLCRRFVQRLAFAPFDEIQDRSKIEQPRAFRLAWFPDGHAAEISFSRTLVEFRAAKAGVKFDAAFGASDPYRQTIDLVLKQLLRTDGDGPCGPSPRLQAPDRYCVVMKFCIQPTINYRDRIFASLASNRKDFNG